MKSKKVIFGMASFLVLAALTGCRPTIPTSSENPTSTGGSGSSIPPVQKTKIDFWTGFGAAVNGVLEPLITRFEAANPDIDVVYETKGGYPNLKQAISQSVSNNAFPHIANGYPDHFADYANANIMLNLDSPEYIKNSDPNIGVNIDEYWPDYMSENRTLIDGATMGMPFNKSTEIMVANQSFFDVAKLKDPDIFLPKTWQDLAEVGPKLKAVAQTNGWFGKLVQKDGSVLDKPENPTPAQIEALQATTAFDMSKVKTADDFIPFSWDSTSNFFITMLRQWGAEYTRRGATFQKGTIEFHRGDSRAKTLAGLTFFQNLYKAKLVGTPQTYGEELYSSNPFKNGRLVLTISSSAGVKENLPNAVTDYPFTVSVNPILYNADLPENKYVISQGTNLALFRRGKATDAKTKVERAAAWKLLRYLTYEVNHEFGKGTGYFPVTDGSKLEVDEANPRYQDYKLYTDFLAETTGSPADVSVRDTAILQANVYQDPEEAWIKFVDAAFIGSSRVRDEVQYVMGQIFADAKTPEMALNAVVSQLSDFV